MAKMNSITQDKSKAPNILLLQPQTKERQKVIDLVRQAVLIELPNAELQTIDDLNYVFKSTPEVIRLAVSDADVVIGSLEGGNQSVYLGLGVARSENKPILLIAPEGRSLAVPTGLFNSRLYLFSFDAPDQFVDTFGRHVYDAWEGGTTGASQTSNNSIFISYSHKDAEFLNRLMVHLRPLDKAGLVRPWADTQLKAGDLWQKEIEKALDQATAAILLVSADFMASEFIVENELPPLLVKAEVSGTRIIPVIVKPCRFTRDKHLARFQAINEPRRPLISLSEADREEIYDRIAVAVEDAVIK